MHQPLGDLIATNKTHNDSNLITTRLRPFAVSFLAKTPVQVRPCLLLGFAATYCTRLSALLPA
jgi:hypothetical protein